MKTRSLDLSGYEMGYTPKNLKTLLVRHGVTQSDLCKALGISKPMMYRYCQPIGSPNHSDCPLLLWIDILNWFDVKRFENLK